MAADLPKTRKLIARGFSLVEDSVYIGLALVLAVSAIALLVVTAINFAGAFFSADLPSQIIPLLDRILLILLVVELLYTVQVSFREHSVTPEPFLLIGLIAAIRRVLILTAEIGHGGQPVATQLILELAVLSALIVAIALSLYVLRRAGTADKAARS
ncbi:MAG: phosphate-starvation-inducible PsiE family protein [Thermoanaerobaculia bacterium]